MEEREEIAITLEKGRSKAGIGRAIGRRTSAISREARRDGDPIRRRASQARKRGGERKKLSHAKERPSNPFPRSLGRSTPAPLRPDAGTNRGADWNGRRSCGRLL
ncbi:MAG: helix-turn-helix domain-containing protein [Treponema sp.]|nr:helix-turn-helix domain-containing protein [Treponema sp.]